MFVIFLYKILLVKHRLGPQQSILAPKFLRHVGLNGSVYFGNKESLHAYIHIKSVYFGILAFNNYLRTQSSTVVNMYIILEFYV